MGDAYKDYRRIAINRMASVYGNAAAVVFIDKQLTDAESNHPFVRHFSLLNCDWIHRLWTFQEVALPQPHKVHIVFGDELIQLSDLLCLHNTDCIGEYETQFLLVNSLVSRLQLRSEDPDPSRYIEAGGLKDILTSTDRQPDAQTGVNFPDFPYEEIKLITQGLEHIPGQYEGLLDAIITRMGVHKKPPGHRALMLEALVQTLSLRRTTEPADEAFCAAIYVGIDMENLPYKPILKDVLLELGEVTASLLFSGTPRSQTPGFRWAPASFLSQPGQMRPVSPDRFGFVSPVGLEISLPALFLHSESYVYLQQEMVFTHLDILNPSDESASSLVPYLQESLQARSASKDHALILLPTKSFRADNERHTDMGQDF